MKSKCDKLKLTRIIYDDVLASQFLQHGLDMAFQDLGDRFLTIDIWKGVELHTDHRTSELRSMIKQLVFNFRL